MIKFYAQEVTIVHLRQDFLMITHVLLGLMCGQLVMMPVVIVWLVLLEDTV